MARAPKEMDVDIQLEFEIWMILCNLDTFWATFISVKHWTL